MSNIDWGNPEAQVSTHFTVKDCLWLPQWNRLANETDGLTEEIKHNLINTCAKMEGVRAFLGNRPLIVHCMYRPPLYNKLVKGAPQSGHLFGIAVDFHVSGLSDNKGCDSIRAILVPKLKEFDMRMEDVSAFTSRNWIHLDTKNTSGTRYFKP